MTILLCILGWIACAVETAWLVNWTFDSSRTRWTDEDVWLTIFFWPIALPVTIGYLVVTGTRRLFP